MITRNKMKTSHTINEIKSVYHSGDKVSINFAYALLLATPIRVLISYLHSEDTDQSFPHFVRNFTIKKINSTTKLCTKQEVLNMYSLFRRSSGRKRMFLGKFLVEIVGKIPATIIHKLFHDLINSDSPLERGWAYRIFPNLETGKMIKRVEAAFNKFGDWKAMEVLFTYSSLVELKPSLKNIWENEDIAWYLKIELLKRICKEQPSLLKIIKEVDTVTYLYGCVLSNKKISEKTGYKLAKQAKTQRSLRFSLWCLGTLGFKKAIMKIYHEYKEIASKIPDTRSEAELDAI